jgi:ASC-1-like (ASCH) protein
MQCMCEVNKNLKINVGFKLILKGFVNLGFEVIKRMEYKPGDLVLLIMNGLRGRVLELTPYGLVRVMIDEWGEETVTPDQLRKLENIRLTELPPVAEKESMEAGQASSKVIPVIDLHYDVIKPKDTEIPMNERLEFQMKLFRNSLAKAISMHLPGIIFIHGRGQQILQKRIEEHLKMNKIFFCPADEKKFGKAGAIEIHFKK